MSIALSLPANLLLCGEYLILLQGGLGAAAALDIRLQAESGVSRTGEFRLVGLFAKERAEWREKEARPGLIPSILTSIKGRFGLSSLPPIEITLDSRAFYDKTGRKLGYGSSAAAVCALVALLTAEISGSIPDREELLRIAIGSYREAQNGRGSGYDIACSLFGGIGIFRGGSHPTWRSLELPWLTHLLLKNFGEAVSSRQAVEAFEELLARDQRKTEEFFKRNNRIIAALGEAPDRETGLELLRRAKELGVEIGRALGVTAEIPEGEGRFWKASGAGDELGYSPAEGEETGAIPISREGLRFE